MSALAPSSSISSISAMLGRRLSPLDTLIARIAAKVSERTRRPWFDLQRNYFYKDKRGITSIEDLRSALEHFHVQLPYSDLELLFVSFPLSSSSSPSSYTFDFKSFAARMFPDDHGAHTRIVPDDDRFIDQAFANNNNNNYTQTSRNQYSYYQGPMSTSSIMDPNMSFLGSSNSSGMNAGFDRNFTDINASKSGRSGKESLSNSGRDIAYGRSSGTSPHIQRQDVDEKKDSQVVDASMSERKSSERDHERRSGGGGVPRYMQAARQSHRAHYHDDCHTEHHHRQHVAGGVKLKPSFARYPHQEYRRSARPATFTNKIYI